jgi:hypothetical protein
MALRPLRQVESIYDNDLPVLATSERGGLLSFASASGLNYVEYARNPSGVVPLGVQLNDIEWLNYEFQPHPHARDVRLPYDCAKVMTQGTVETDWLYVSGQIYAGMPAYAGPSGTFTNIPTLGSYRVGKFMSTLFIDPHIVIFAGLGFTRTHQEYQTHNIVTENNPANMVTIVSPGYARVRIDQATILRSQTGNNL